MDSSNPHDKAFKIILETYGLLPFDPLMRRLEVCVRERHTKEPDDVLRPRWVAVILEAARIFRDLRQNGAGPNPSAWLVGLSFYNILETFCNTAEEEKLTEGQLVVMEAYLDNFKTGLKVIRERK